MKIYAYILIVLSGVLTAQCSKVTLDEICGYPSAPGGGNGEGEGNGDYLRFEFIFQPLDRIFPLRVYDIHLVGCDHLRPFGDIRVIGL